MVTTPHRASAALTLTLLIASCSPAVHPRGRGGAHKRASSDVNGVKFWETALGGVESGATMGDGPRGHPGPRGRENPGAQIRPSISCDPSVDPFQAIQASVSSVPSWASSKGLDLPTPRGATASGSAQLSRTALSREGARGSAYASSGSWQAGGVDRMGGRGGGGAGWQHTGEQWRGARGSASDRGGQWRGRGRGRWGGGEQAPSRVRALA